VSAASELAGALGFLPATLFASQWLDDPTRSRLLDAGFQSTPVPEPLMRCSRRPDLGAGQFVVRAASSPAEVDAAMSLVSEAHKVPRSLLAPVFGSVAVDERSAVWLAWEETEPVSTVWTVTVGDVVAVVEMMTPERHQGRGAGRQLLAAALHGLWPESGGQALLLSSAAGRKLYESLGFVALDEATTFTRGADEDALIAIGQR
jgi:hypothetical protein